MAAEDAHMHALSLSPLSRPLPLVGLSPNLTPYSPPTQPCNFLAPPRSFSLPPHVLSKEDVEQEHDEASDLFDADSASFSLYHSTGHDDEPTALSPISAASLSPPSLASSASSVASVSSASPPPCSNCSCCSTARRLSALVAGLKQKTAHTQSLVAVYQQTQQRLQYTDQQLEQLNARYATLAATHQQCELRHKRRREEDERRQVRLQAHESHIVQLKATLSKLQHEKDERVEREKSIKALQRERDALTKQTSAMRAQLAAMHAPVVKQQPTQPPVAAVSSSGCVAADDVEWLPDTTSSHPVVPTVMQPQQRPTAASASDEDEIAMFDVSRTMALAEAAITALKGEVRKRNDIIRQMRVEQRDYRKALKDAGITLPAHTRSNQGAGTRKRRRRDSKPDREKELVTDEMKPEELDAFAADVMSAMAAADEGGGVGERVTRQGMGGSLLTADGHEVAEEEQKDKVDEVEKPVVRKRGRPRIHPIKDKTALVRRASRPRRVKVESAHESSETPQPSSAAVHKASIIALQQATTLLSSLLFASAIDEADLVQRCLAMVCECLCSSHTLPSLASLLPPSAPVPFVVTVLPPAFSSVESCHRCLPKSVAGATACSVSCSTDAVLHWDELSAVALRLLTGGATTIVERWMAVIQRLDEALLGRRQTQRPSDTTNAAVSLLELVSYQATITLLSQSPLSTADQHTSLTISLLLHVTRLTKQPAYVFCLLLSSYCSPQPSLSLLENVAQFHPQLLTHSAAQRTFHIKTMRLIAAAHLSTAASASNPTSAPTSTLGSLYPTLASLLSSELSSLSSASRDFVFGRLQSELILHASVTNFSSLQQYQSLSSSLLASFHILFIHLTFPAAQSMVMSAVLPAIPKAKSPLNSLVLLLTLPSLVTCALHHLVALSQRRPRPRKEESYTRAQLAAVLHHAMESMGASEDKHGKATADGGLLMRAGGCEVLLRALDEVQRRREVKVLKDEEDVRVLRAAVDGWLGRLSEADVREVCGEVDEKRVSGWELLGRVREQVSNTRQWQV